MSTAETKTLARMTAEVVENNTAHGWYENCATFPEAMALLHSEVSEALDAWRKYGLKDVTKTPWSFNDRPGEVYPPKPEGVPSEFADIFIRLLDDAWMFGQVDLEKADSPGRYGIHDSFAANMNVFHDLISRASAVWESDPGKYMGRPFAGILRFLRQLCEHYEIDLLAEYEKKMAYNRTRPYRHGNRRI